MNKSNLKNVLEKVLRQKLTKESYKVLYNALYYRLVVCDHLSSVKCLTEDYFSLNKSCDNSFYYLTVYGHYTHFIYLSCIPGIKECCYGN